MTPSFLSSPQLTWIEPFLSDHKDASLFVVGGAVRDELLGRSTHDFDLVVTQITPEDLETWLSQHGTVSFIGTRFGVWKFRPHHDPLNPEIDIALPRREVAIGKSGGYRQFLIESDPTLPIQEDLARRDFTINAIAYDWRTGELVDPFHGQADLKERLIRAVGDPATRFQEDSSRLLRALRFTVQLKCTIEGSTWQALVALMSRLNLTEHSQRLVARELITEEFVRTLTADAKRCIELYQTSGAWKEIFNNNPSPVLLPTIERTHLPLFTETFPPPTPELFLSLICLDLFPDASTAYTFLHLWRFETQVNVKAIVEMVRMWHTAPSAPSLAQIERSLLPHEDLLAPLLFCLNNTLAHQWMEQLLQTKKRHTLPFLITGKTLQSLGIPEGPSYHHLLDLIRSKQLAGTLETFEEARDLVLSIQHRTS